LVVRSLDPAIRSRFTPVQDIEVSGNQPVAGGLARRGFPSTRPETTRRLEGIGRAFIAATNQALGDSSLPKLLAYVDGIGSDYRGFAVEGATFGVALADAVNMGAPSLPAWFKAVAPSHTYLAHVGLGWTIARVPWRRRVISPLLDPVHRWLVEDGAGFHDCFFRSRRVLGGWRRYRHGYAAKAYDQGVGRALWFASGGDLRMALLQVQHLGNGRGPDLLSGLGLAMAYAGGISVAELRNNLSGCGTDERAILAQGAAFAAEAMVRAGHVHQGSAEIVMALAGTSPEDAAALVRDRRSRLGVVTSVDDEPYEIWRRDIRQALRGTSEGAPT
jgi:hypothetical protein